MLKKLAIIVPYRDREAHLRRFIPHMLVFLKAQPIDFTIFIIEQDEGKPFNRGKLLNVGFDITRDRYDYFCFHDIDMLPQDRRCDYSYVQGACRLSHYVSQFSYLPRPPSEFGGGVILIDKPSFITVNGYDNEYWGWGVEDNDFKMRCDKANISVTFREGLYESLDHPANGDTYGAPPSPETMRNRDRIRELLVNDQLGTTGLSDLFYSTIKSDTQPSYKKIVVSI